MSEFVWTLEPWYHIDGISIMRCNKYDVTESLGVKITAYNTSACGHTVCRYSERKDWMQYYYYYYYSYFNFNFILFYFIF